jgi:antitoxin (DNA-binding transcriptional repressor) of toxin-antitoxin stability system
MAQINVSQFKARCLSLLDSLEPNGLVITRRGRPIARVMPMATPNDTAGAELVGGMAELVGGMNGRLGIRGHGKPAELDLSPTRRE